MIVDSFYEKFTQFKKRPTTEMNPTCQQLPNHLFKTSSNQIYTEKNEKEAKAFECKIELEQKRKCFRPNLQFIQEVSKSNELRKEQIEEYEMKEMNDGFYPHIFQDHKDSKYQELSLGIQVLFN